MRDCVIDIIQRHKVATRFWPAAAADADVAARRLSMQQIQKCLFCVEKVRQWKNFEFTTATAESWVVSRFKAIVDHSKVKHEEVKKGKKKKSQKSWGARHHKMNSY